MTQPDLWVLTCAPLSRKREAEDLFNNLEVSEDRRVIVTTWPDPIYSFDGHLLTFESEEINISKWWRMGLEYIASHYTEGEKWDVLLAESDVFITPEDVEKVRRVMRQEDCVMGGADWQNLTNGIHKVRRDNSEWKPLSRLPGFALVVAGEARLSHDPQFRWWLADDDFEWTHRVHGGTVLVSGTTLRHEGTQGPLTGDRLKAWEEDLPRFRRKWGAIPTEG